MSELTDAMPSARRRCNKECRLHDLVVKLVAARELCAGFVRM
jgi:hypothetical protein